MSQIFSYFKNFFHSSPSQDRKRRINELHPEESVQLPKYRRVSNIFPKRYNQRIDDDDRHFQKVKQNRLNYTAILDSFIMEQQNKQRKQFSRINNEEFSDEEDPSRFREPNPQERRAKASSSGYRFSSNMQSTGTPSTFNFSQQRNQPSTHENRHMEFSAISQRARKLPELVPITHTARESAFQQNGFMPNGSRLNVNSQPRGRSSMFDFSKKNRAFNDSPVTKMPNSILDRNHNLNVKSEYENLLRKLIPNFAKKAPTKINNEPIATVDLSSDETDNDPPPINNSIFPRPSFQTRQYREFDSDFKKPSIVPFVDISDDDDDDLMFTRQPPFSSTLIQDKKPSSPTSSKSTSSSLIIPSVKPVNSLRERYQSKNCLKDDCIDEIVRKFKASHRNNDTQISDELLNVSKLSLETTEQSKLQQRRIDNTVSALKQCIIDAEDEVVDEFPRLTEQQLNNIRWALKGGPSSQIVVSKFNMNITRHDLITLEGQNWLNDEVINFYMELIRLRSEEVDFMPKIHAMNTFFMVKLLGSGYSGVRRWTRKVDIFSMDIIPVPVHVGKVHWCMAIIHMREKSIRYYDSMGHPNEAVLSALEGYLKEESLEKRKIPLDTSDWTIENVPDCPQQRNGSDCGVFSCMFAEFICRDSRITFEQQHMPYFRHKMVFEISSGKLILGY